MIDDVDDDDDDDDVDDDDDDDVDDDDDDDRHHDDAAKEEGSLVDCLWDPCQSSAWAIATWLNPQSSSSSTFSNPILTQLARMMMMLVWMEPPNPSIGNCQVLQPKSLTHTAIRSQDGIPLSPSPHLSDAIIGENFSLSVMIFWRRRRRRGDQKCSLQKGITLDSGGGGVDQASHKDTSAPAIRGKEKEQNPMNKWHLS